MSLLIKKNRVKSSQRPASNRIKIRLLYNNDSATLLSFYNLMVSKLPEKLRKRLFVTGNERVNVDTTVIMLEFDHEKTIHQCIKQFEKKAKKQSQRCVVIICNAITEDCEVCAHYLSKCYSKGLDTDFFKVISFNINPAPLQIQAFSNLIKI